MRLLLGVALTVFLFVAGVAQEDPAGADGLALRVTTTATPEPPVGQDDAPSEDPIEDEQPEDASEEDIVVATVSENPPAVERDLETSPSTSTSTSTSTTQPANSQTTTATTPGEPATSPGKPATAPGEPATSQRSPESRELERRFAPLTSPDRQSPSIELQSDDFLPRPDSSQPEEGQSNNVATTPQPGPNATPPSTTDQVTVDPGPEVLALTTEDRASNARWYTLIAGVAAAVAMLSSSARANRSATYPHEG